MITLTAVWIYGEVVTDQNDQIAMHPVYEKQIVNLTPVRKQVWKVGKIYINYYEYQSLFIHLIIYSVLNVFKVGWLALSETESIAINYPANR